MTSELKACPFCGSEAAMHQAFEPDGPNDQGYYIDCGGCGASTNVRFACGEDPRPLLREQWNRRDLADSGSMALEAAAAMLRFQESEIERLRADVKKLRVIASYVPARIYIRRE